MTTRIYYTEPSCRAFEATVVRALDVEGRPAVTLDRTAFYPASGGQPFDTGRLGPVSVVETIDDQDDIIHVVSAPLEPGAAVRGEIDWARRFDHMQQHTGQHLLSAAFDRLFDNRTVGFHMGSADSTIDLAREPSGAEMDAAAAEANRVIWDDQPVSVRFVSPAEAAQLPLRKEPAREGPLRLVEITGFDLSACGGTHVARTGAVGSIAVLASERLRGGARLTFVCGGRALTALGAYRDAVAAGVRALSVLPSELPGAIDRLQAEARGLRKQVKQLHERLAVFEGAHLAATAREAGGIRWVVDVVDGWDVAGLKLLAAAAMGPSPMCIVLLTAETPAAVVAACSPSIPLDANVVVQQLTARFGGRGGGKPGMAQGGGLAAPPADIAAAVRALIESTLSQ